MESNRKINFPFLLITLIIGIALVKLLNFKTLEVEKPALAVVYFAAFVLGIVLLCRDYFSKKKK